ncbi:hypothetical protein DERP_008258 [Dermatophagoides pteronyssinus]|uniref:Uncharacterized protein n=1 Tax=Dermatophagoides pteronyssinus TaxID=6956 RepID=A0ABQ8J623_DERPT|nr:hypothetical protein DERP_008258 [Dermatophagoides pteronyssinus]
MPIGTKTFDDIYRASYKQQKNIYPSSNLKEKEEEEVEEIQNLRLICPAFKKFMKEKNKL